MTDPRWTRPFRALRSRPRLLAGLIVGLVVLGAGMTGLSLGVWRNVCYDCPSIAQIYAWEPKKATRILDDQGRTIAELFQERRTPVVLDSLPPYVPRAFIAVEDKRFYRHGAFDPLGYARAARNRLLGQAGGGSTITLQLARNMFVEKIGFNQSLTRKLKELKVAIELERVYTKDEILQAYINQINYGHGWYGIETAAQRYFGKSASALDPAEAAMLAAVINLPGHFSPFRNPKAALQRRNLVLSLMKRQGYLTPQQAAAAEQEPLPTTPHGADESEVAPYFVEMVRDMLDDRYGSEVYRAGYRVYTTLDLDMQKRATAAMQQGFERIEQQPNFRHPTYAKVHADSTRPRGSEMPYIEGMMIVTDPGSGAIRALIGGRDFEDSKFDRATQAMRQPGSVFKPFVYESALASGIPASHIIYDSPVMVEQADGTVWSPKNYDGEFHGPMTLREGLRRSINVVAVKLAQEVGLETVAQFAQRMGIETPIPRYPSIAIGAADVIPMQVAEAYGVLANRGTRVRPRAILRIEDSDGRTLWESRVEKQPVLDSLSSYIMLDMMRDVVDHGSAFSIRDPARGDLPTALPAAGKTGTTNDATDVWFSGFTPDLLAVVWFGFDRPQTILPAAAGGTYAAPVWADFMKSVYFGPDSLRAVPPEWPQPPELITRSVDDESGKLATEWCPADHVYQELFIPGTQPTEACDLHGPGAFGRGPLPIGTPADSDSAGIQPAESARVRVNPRFKF